MTRSVARPQSIVRVITGGTAAAPAASAVARVLASSAHNVAVKNAAPRHRDAKRGARGVTPAPPAQMFIDGGVRRRASASRAATYAIRTSRRAITKPSMGGGAAHCHHRRLACRAWLPTYRDVRTSVTLVRMDRGNRRCFVLLRRQSPAMAYLFDRLYLTFFFFFFFFFRRRHRGRVRDIGIAARA